MYKYIELNRRFLEINNPADGESSSFESYVSARKGDDPIGIHWDAILSGQDSLVILGEPGSGKTEELQAQVSNLTNQRKCAAFIELGQMVNATSPPLSAHSVSLLNGWRNGTSDAWLFLDAVDESKLVRVSDFRAALARIAEWVGVRRHRTRYVISSRISEWRFGQDEDWVREVLLVSNSQLFKSVPEQTKRGYIPTTEIGVIAYSNSTRPAQKLKLLKILPLSLDQASRFLIGRGENPTPFIENIVKIDALDFVGRPADVLDLFALWKERGSIGTKVDALDQSTTFKLRVKDDRSSIPPQVLREGSEVVSACLHLSRRLRILVDQTGSVVRDDSISLNECLPQSWSDSNRRELIKRALFDGETFNHVRLHHRIHQDYLAACWLRRLMEGDCPYRELQQLVFDKQRNGGLVLRPFMKSVAAWLACIPKENQRWATSFMTDLLDHAPWLFLAHGDPQSLPLQDRRTALRKIVEHCRGRSQVDIDWDPTALRRFSDPALSDDISNWLRDETISSDVRADYVNLVLHGQLHSAMDAVVAIASDGHADEYLRATALGCIARIGSVKHRQTVFEAARVEVSIPSRILGWIALCIYPDAANEGALFDILSKISSIPPKYSISSFHSFEQEVLHDENRLTEDRISPLLQALMGFLGGSENKARSDRSWVVGWLEPLIARLFCRRGLNGDETNLIIEALTLLSSAAEQQLTQDWHGEDKKPLNERSLQHPALRRIWYWRQYDLALAKRDGDVNYLFQLDHYYSALSTAAQDHVWWFEDALSLRGDRGIFALRASLDTRSSSRSIFHWLPPVKIFYAAIRNDSLHPAIRGIVIDFFLAPYRRIKSRWEHKWQRRRYWAEKWRPVRDWYWYWHNKSHLMLNIHRIGSGQWWSACQFVVERARRNAEGRNNSTWGGLRSDDLNRPFGPIIGRAVGKGIDKHWREFAPALPHEKPSRNETSAQVIYGLIALDIAWSSNGMPYFSSLTPEDARRVTRYALNELNGIPAWLEFLCVEHSSVVKEVLTEAVIGEWRAASQNDEFGSQTISRLAWYESSGFSLPALVLPVIQRLLLDTVAGNNLVLTEALRIVVKHDSAVRQWLPALAMRRLSESVHSDQEAWIWLMILMQLDANEALHTIATWCLSLQPSVTSEIAVNVCAALANRHDRGTAIADPDYLKAKFLEVFIPWVYKNVPPATDPVHDGAYSPGPRDDAVHFRSRLVEHLITIDDDDAEVALQVLAELPEMSSHRDWIVTAADRRRSRMADNFRLLPTDVFDLYERHERLPRCRADLFYVAQTQIEAFKDRVERAENSIRHEALLSTWLEKDYQLWIKGHLDAASHARYTLPAEAEIDPGRFPDLRFENPQIDSAVSVEIKLADKWTYPDLVDRLRNQLVGQYLRAPSANYGIYLLFTNGTKSHWNPSPTESRTWRELIVDLQSIADELRKPRLHIEQIVVIGIDLKTPRT